MSSNSLVMFDQATQAPSQRFGALVAAGEANDLGEGIRGSYGIVSIKAGRFRIKYKGQEQIILDRTDPAQPKPVATIDVVIVKANPFLNKQYYQGKYTEGSKEPPTCYSLDGKVPSPAVQRPVHSNCAMCPKNQFGSLIGENGVKQKACRDTKKLAIVPLGNLRNEALGGPMLFRVPPSSLKELSTMADALKARGYPYNSVAVRIGFDMDVSHPKPTFRALRPLTDDEAEVVLELYNSDGVERVLADNDIVVDPDHAAPPAAGQFIHEPAPVRDAATPPPAPPAQAAPPPPPPQPQAFAPPPPPPPAPVPQQPTFVAPPSGPAVGAVAVQPFVPGAAPPPVPAAWGAPVEASPRHIVLPPEPPAAPAPAPEPAAAPKATRRKPVEPVAAPAAPMEPTEAPAGSQLDSDINSILAGLSSFTGGK